MIIFKNMTTQIDLYLIMCLHELGDFYHFCLLPYHTYLAI